MTGSTARDPTVRASTVRASTVRASTVRESTVVLTADEIASARAVTPGCDPSLGQIHLNHAGCSLPPQVVLDTQVDYLRTEGLHGGYEVAASHAQQVSAVYESIAHMLGAQPLDIARFEHATAAWNAAFWSVPMGSGQRILVPDHEYGANAVAYLHAAQTTGVVIVRVPRDPTGQVSVDAMADELDAGDVALVSLTHVPTNGGLVNPAAEIGRLTRAAGVPYLVDACQSVGQLDLDVDVIGCDFLSATGRKYLRGPRGTGFLYVRPSILDVAVPSQPDHHGADLVRSDRFELRPGARRFEHWEYNYAAWLGLGAAVDHALGWGLSRIESTVFERADQLRTVLVETGFTVFDEGDRRCGIVTVADTASGAGRFGARRRSATELREWLHAHRINCSVTDPGSSRWDVASRNLPPLLRLSVHYTTTVAELERTAEVLTASEPE
jgi:selenocysteine lyase/cysteine desulfurase